MKPLDALVTITYCVLSVQGKAADPTLNDITTAMVQAAPLIGFTEQNDAAVECELDATRVLVERHHWTHASLRNLDGRGHDGDGAERHQPAADVSPAG